MGIKAVFQREDGTGYLASFLGNNSESVAVGNGWSGFSYVDINSRNAITHAHMSASVTTILGRSVAETLGDWKEVSPQSIDSRDEYRDQYNNEIGRRIAEWLNSWLQSEAASGRFYNEQQKEKFLDDLVVDAYHSGDIIWDLNEDPKLENYSQVPSSDVLWNNPSVTWRDSSLGRNYSMVDNFSEDPIGFVLHIPSNVIVHANNISFGDYDSMEYLLGSVLGTAVNDISSLSQLVVQVQQSFAAIRLTRDPLVIDFDGDGVAEVTNPTRASVYFDMDSNGFAEAVSWVGNDDALLVRDVNANGQIDNANELFGTATIDGFTVLKIIDSNNDNIINSSDTAWGSLQVWPRDILRPINLSHSDRLKIKDNWPRINKNI